MRRPVFDHDGLDYGIVRELAARVGEQLTARREAAEAAGEPGLDGVDERALSRALITEELQTLATDALRAGEEPHEPDTEKRLAQAVFDQLHGLGRIQPLLEADAVTDIHINGCDVVWLRLTDGSQVRGPAVADTDQELIGLIAEAARRAGRGERRFDAANWSLDLRLPSGARLHAMRGVSDRPAVSIRRHDYRINRLDHLVTWGTVDPHLQAFLSAAVAARCNLIVAGGTNTGKTTTLRCLLNEIGPEERLITIEDHDELAMGQFADRHPNLVSLVARTANTEGIGQVSVAELVYQTLRADPDRVIVGEIRGAEAVPMLLAMSQGNDGSMSTMHASSTEQTFTRLYSYASMAAECPSEKGVHQLFASAVDFVIHLQLVEGTRRVTSVREIIDVVDGQLVSAEVWRPGPEGRAVPNLTGLSEAMANRLKQGGFDPWPGPRGVAGL